MDGILLANFQQFGELQASSIASSFSHGPPKPCLSSEKSHRFNVSQSK